MERIKLSNGVWWVAIPEEKLYVLCGCPADSIKHLFKQGLIHRVEKDGVQFETGPNAILLSDVSMQRGTFCNLAEFPVLQMLYRQGMIVPGHPGNTGRKPMLIGLPEQVKSQSEYIFRGNYGLRSRKELEETGADPETIDTIERMKRWFSFDRNRETSELLDLRPIEHDAVRLSENVFLHRRGVNRFLFICKGETVEVDLNLGEGEEYQPPYVLESKPIKRNYFSVVHSGDGDGWDTRRPCMASIIVFQGRIYLIDAGPTIMYSLTSLGIGIGEIDGIFQTHAHDDHCAGLTALIRADHRIGYYAAPLVRASVAKKLSALMGMDEDRFGRYFDIHDLEIGSWNDVHGLEVRPVLSPHPVETTILFFRTPWENGYKTYAHLADIASFSVLDSMKTADPTKGGISAEFDATTRAEYLSPFDLKKIDIGGGMIHGNAVDFTGDRSTRLLLSHTARELTTAERAIGSNAEFGEEDELIPSRWDDSERLALDALRLNFPAVPTHAITMLANCPVVNFQPGSILIRHGAETFPIYLILTGVIEYINVALGAASTLSYGFIAGETACIEGTKADGTYRALGAASALKIPASLYRDFIQSNDLGSEIARLREYREFLRNSKLCGEIVSWSLQVRIARSMERIGLAAGESLPESGETYLYIVESGSLEIRSRNRSIEAVVPGCFAGEDRILLRSSVLYSCRAILDSTVFRIPSKVVDEIPLVLWKLQEAYDRRIRIIGAYFKFAWFPEYSVGIEEFDFEHRLLFERIEAIAHACEEVSPQACRETFPALVAAAKAHFTHEEGIMTTMGYPEFSRQSREHAGFIAELERYCETLDDGAMPDPETCLSFLKNWLIRHTLGEDRRYIDFFRATGMR
jgi:hemerythrin